MKKSRRVLDDTVLSFLQGKQHGQFSNYLRKFSNFYNYSKSLLLIFLFRCVFPYYQRGNEVNMAVSKKVPIFIIHNTPPPPGSLRDNRRYYFIRKSKIIPETRHPGIIIIGKSRLVVNSLKSHRLHAIVIFQRYEMKNNNTREVRNRLKIYICFFIF